MTRTCIILAFIAGSLTAEDGAAPPAGHQPPDRAAIFAKSDADADGKLSLQEFLAGWRANEKNGPGGGDGKMIDEIFAKADADGSGQISKEEFKAFHERMRERREGQQGQEGKGLPEGKGEGKGPDGKGPPGRKDPREFFLNMDADQDGFVSREEFTQFKPKPRPEGKPEGKPEGPPRE